MKTYIFHIQVPIPDSEEYKSYEFADAKIAAEMLKIPLSTFYTLANGKLKCTRKSMQHLNKIKITKTLINPDKEKKDIDIDLYAKELYTLLEKKFGSITVR